MTTIRIEGEQLAYRASGQGVPLVLVQHQRGNGDEHL